MAKFSGLKLATPALAVFLGLGLTQGCAASEEESCGAELSAKVDSLTVSVTALQAVAAEMQADLSIACTGLAGETEDDSLTEEALNDKCGEAAAVINAAVTAGLTIELVPGKCEVNASAQMNCEASCSVDGSCDPGSVEARCEPGNVSVSCEGECSGSVSCEGSATVAAECEGSCSGSCTGSCEGTCNGSCDGTCSAEVMNAEGQAECRGTCDGECTGTCSAKCTGTCDASCELAADAQVECTGEARCHGECTGTATAPKCEAELEPPECNLDADCQAGCDGQASFEAECTPPALVIAGELDAEVAADIELYLPQVLEIFAKAELAFNAAGGVAQAAVNVAGEVSGTAACAASVGAEFTAKMQAAAEAQASVNVSFEASASVNAEASAG